MLAYHIDIYYPLSLKAMIKCPQVRIQKLIMYVI